MSAGVCIRDLELALVSDSSWYRLRNHASAVSQVSGLHLWDLKLAVLSLLSV